jgi:hypothetical protein
MENLKPKGARSRNGKDQGFSADQEQLRDWVIMY